MNKILTTLFILFSIISFGQACKQKSFDSKDYPATKYSTKFDKFSFKDFSIELVQVKLKDNKKSDAISLNCRVWLTVKHQDKTIDKLIYSDCESLGGCSGIFVDTQKNKNHFILSKFGDYDGEIIIIDSFGKINKFLGGNYYLSDDSKYLFSTYDSDLSGLTVYDLSQDKLLFTSDSLKDYLADFYFLNNKYFAIINADVKKADLSDILTFDFKSKKLIKTTVDDSYLKKAKRLKLYNDIIKGPCHCGRTTEKYSR